METSQKTKETKQEPKQSDSDIIALQQRQEWLSKHPNDYLRFSPAELKHIKKLKGYHLGQLQAYTGYSLYSICRFLNCRPTFLSERSKIIIQNAIVQEEPIPDEYLTLGRKIRKKDLSVYYNRKRIRQKTLYKSAIEAMKAINENYQDVLNINKTIILYLQDEEIRNVIDELYENLSLIKYGETIDQLEKPAKSVKKRLTDNNVYLKKILQEIQHQMKADESELKLFREYDSGSYVKGTSYKIDAKAVIEKEGKETI